MFIRETIVAEHERALLIRDGRLVKVLEPGIHRVSLNHRRVQVERFDVRVPAFTSEWARVIEKNHPELAERYLTVVRTEPNQVALVSFEGVAAFLVAPGRTAYYWKVLRDVTVAYVDVEATPRVPAALYDAWRMAMGQSVKAFAVDQNSVGLLHVDGQLTERLEPGWHAFWALNRTIRADIYDLRPQLTEIAAQEILTKDRVSVRMTLTAFTRIVDAETVSRTAPDHEGYVYRVVQLAAREAVGGRTLDQLLNDRVAVDAEIAEQTRARLAGTGLEVAEVRVKDVILPGEMRALLNRVVEAEKAAQANLIRRQEETAATRSLLNTARLMDDNPTLMRLKELEALEKLMEKIGHIELHAGKDEGFDALLNGLVRIGKTAETNGRAD